MTTRLQRKTKFHSAEITATADMVCIAICQPCGNGDHDKCVGSRPAPPGNFGGFSCSCGCCRDKQLKDRIQGLRAKTSKNMKARRIERANIKFRIELHLTQTGWVIRLGDRLWCHEFKSSIDR